MSYARGWVVESEGEKTPIELSAILIWYLITAPARPATTATSRRGKE
jgi:hypothetical protein